MNGRQLLFACICTVLFSYAAQAQTSAAPVAPAVAATQPRNPAPTDPAGAAEVPLTPDKPAAVTAPGASAVTTDPIVPTGQLAPAGVVAETREQLRGAFEADPDAYSIVSAGKGLSLNKPMYLLPATYSEQYHGSQSEMIFQISLKQRLFSLPLYLAYTQKTFLDWFDSNNSKPVRSTDYNPEAFYRFIPADRDRWYHLGADIGFEHESNGKDLPDSRSWNRIYIAPFQAAGQHLIYWKWWYRIPDAKNKAPTDPGRDDNPDIQDYYGYSELHLEQQFFGKQLANLMIRYNPVTGRGAANLLYTIPNKQSDPSFFWTFYLWQGYGESLIDYNHSITRIGVGLSLAR